MVRRLGVLSAGLALAMTMMMARSGVLAETPRLFEVNGFVQGMHEAAAKDLARKKGFEFHETETGAIISKGAHGDPVLFCRDELVRSPYTTRGGFMQYLRQIRSFEGQGFRRTNLDLGTQMAPDGKEAGHLTIYFFRPGDYYFATITLLGTEDYDTDGFVIGYEALDKVAKCR